jgi:hypothetical protein
VVAEPVEVHREQHCGVGLVVVGDVQRQPPDDLDEHGVLTGIPLAGHVLGASVRHDNRHRQAGHVGAVAHEPVQPHAVGGLAGGPRVGQALEDDQVGALTTGPDVHGDRAQAGQVIAAWLAPLGIWAVCYRCHEYIDELPIIHRHSVFYS